ncbi:MAG: hypothetical protein HXY34_10540 [Candidatus Thorarchaeota archaeon]|nr:hypothetical protein [Candidatus Thorarchaeota archaeon]
MGEVVNASRVVKYVVTLGCRYQSYGLVDMRVQDVNVVADLNRNDPNNPNPTEPEEQDGIGERSVESLTPSANTVSYMDFAESVAQSIFLWWEGWWPRLHASISFVTPAGSACAFHCSVDLLFDFSIESINAETPSSRQMTAQQKEEWGSNVAASIDEQGPWQDFHRTLAEKMVHVIFGVSLLLALPAVGTQVWYIVLTCILMSSVWQFALYESYELGFISADFALALVLLWLNTLWGQLVPTFQGALLFSVVFAVLILKMRTIAWAITKIKTTIYAFALNFLLALQWLVFWTLIAEKSTQTYIT